MRLVSLGAGRDRALADVALRLAQDLRSDGEPALGLALPPRWNVDPQLKAPNAPFQRRAAARSQIPKEVLQSATCGTPGSSRPSPARPASTKGTPTRQ